MSTRRATPEPTAEPAAGLGADAAPSPRAPAGRARLPVGARAAMLAAIARAGLPPLPDPAALRAALDEARAEPENAPEATSPRPAAPEPTAADDLPTPPTPIPPAPALPPAWDRLPRLALDPRHLARQLVVTAGRADPAHGAFDVLRARIVEALAARGWRRVGVTSPTKGCGKSFTAVNLAVTLSRFDDCPTLLLDLDLRIPAIARTLGVASPGSMGDLLRGLAPPEAVLRRVGPNALKVGEGLAVGANGRREPFASELFHDPRAAAALRGIEDALAPRVVLADLPPALAGDDVIAAKPLLDCALMVVGGGQSTPREVKEAVRRLGDLPILAVVLNKGEGEGVADYAY